MPTSLFQYEMLPTTWFYVSAIIILAIFFKFNRFWSVRNFDLIALILLTPGLLFVAGWDTSTGYTWLFCVQCFFVVRLFLDTLLVRRPLLEQNLSFEGLTFASLFLVFFLIAALIVNRGDYINNVNTLRLEQILTARHVYHGMGMNPDTLSIPSAEWSNMPPGFRPFIDLTERASLAFAPSFAVQQKIIQQEFILQREDGYSLSKTEDSVSVLPEVPSPSADSNDFIPSTMELITVETALPDKTESAALHPTLNMWLLMITLIIGGHILIVLEFAYIGYRHFGKLQTGIACVALYLLLPYSTQMIGRLDHVIPAALILGSVVVYRRPLLAGLGIGSAAALVWYPLCLVPLWCDFYRSKGWIRFILGIVSALIVFTVLLCFSPAEWGTYSEQLIHMSGKTAFMIFAPSEGFWTSEDIYYRMPILVLFIVICLGMFFVPAHKHLATLISNSALLMIGVQFLQLHQGGLYLSWYLPLLILIIFRPNLEDRNARTMVG